MNVKVNSFIFLNEHFKALKDSYRQKETNTNIFSLYKQLSNSSITSNSSVEFNEATKWVDTKRKLYAWLIKERNKLIGALAGDLLVAFGRIFVKEYIDKETEDIELSREQVAKKLKIDVNDVNFEKLYAEHKIQPNRIKNFILFMQKGLGDYGPIDQKSHDKEFKQRHKVEEWFPNEALRVLIFSSKDDFWENSFAPILAERKAHTVTKEVVEREKLEILSKYDNLSSEFEFERAMANNGDFKKAVELYRKQLYNRKMAQSYNDRLREAAKNAQFSKQTYIGLLPPSFRAGLTQSIKDLSNDVFKDLDLGVEEHVVTFKRMIMKDKTLKKEWEKLDVAEREEILREHVKEQIKKLQEFAKANPDVKYLNGNISYAEFDGDADTKMGVEFAWKKVPDRAATNIINIVPDGFRRYKVVVGNQVKYDALVVINDFTGETKIEFHIKDKGKDKFKGSYNFTTGKVIIGR